MTDQLRSHLRTVLDERDLVAAPLGTAIAATVVAVLAVLLTFSQPVSGGPDRSAPPHAAATAAPATAAAS